MRHTGTYYAVKMTSQIGPDHEPTFAIGGKYAPVALFYWRKDAVKFRDDLRKHLPNYWMDVVKVTASVEEVAKPTKR